MEISKNPEAYLKPSLKSMMQLFAKIFSGSQPLSIFAKSSTTDVCTGSKQVSEICLKSISKNMKFWQLALKPLLAVAIGTVCSKIQCSSGSSCKDVFCANLVPKFFAKFKGKHP